MKIDTTETPALRAVSGLLRLYGLCARLACRRARACRGEPRDCLMRYAPLVPEDAREGAKAIVAAHARGQSLEELIDEEGHDDVLALAAWSDAAANSCRRVKARQNR